MRRGLDADIFLEYNGYRRKKKWRNERTEKDRPENLRISFSRFAFYSLLSSVFRKDQRLTEVNDESFNSAKIEKEASLYTR